MKYAIFSDIHANLQAWNAVLADLAVHEVDELICLGDIVGYGPRPAETLASVYAHVHHFLLGNHEAAIAGRFDRSQFNEDAWRMIDWTAKQLDDNAVRFFAGLPLVFEIPGGPCPAVCVHGAMHQPEEFNYLMEDEDARLSWAACDAPLIFAGHTHVAQVHVLDGDAVTACEAADFVPEPGQRYIVNVGSVGMPRERDFRACYCIFDAATGAVTFHHTAYDVGAFRRDVAGRLGESAQARALLEAFESKRTRPLREQLDFAPRGKSVSGAIPEAAAAAPATAGAGGRRPPRQIRLKVSKPADGPDPREVRKAAQARARAFTAKVITLIVIFVVLVSAGGAYWFLHRNAGSPPAAAAPADVDRPAIAILPPPSRPAPAVPPAAPPVAAAVPRPRESPLLTPPPPDRTLAADLTRPAAPAGEDAVHAHVPEMKDYQLVYELDLARMGRVIRYDVDRRADITAPFDRIAYALELRQGTEETRYVWVSMDAFTTDLALIGIPTAASRASFQRTVSDLNVFSNVEGVTTGTGLKGNLEFWPNNYKIPNEANVPGAANHVHDFGDAMASPLDGYGSMQVHNYEAKQTLFALNHWGMGGGRADLGIGNNPHGEHPDWTFMKNSGAYAYKRLRVFVRCR